MFKRDSIIIFTVVLTTTLTPIPDPSLGYYTITQPNTKFANLSDYLSGNISDTDLNSDFKNIKSYYLESDKGNWSLALQRVLDLAKDGAEIKVYIPKGTYKIKYDCVVYGNTTIKMDSEAKLVLDGAHRFFINGDKEKEYYGYNGNSNITISGGILDVNKKNRAALSFAHAENILIENVTVKNVVDGHGFELSALKNVLVKDCRFENFSNPDSTKYYSEAIQLDVNTEKAFPSFGAYDETPNDNIVIDGCYFGQDDNPPEGFGAWPTGIGSHSSVPDKWNKNITIKNSIFDGMTYAGIRNLKWNNTTIENNTFKNNVISIAANLRSDDAQPFKDITIQGNTFMNNSPTNSTIVIEGRQKAKTINRISSVRIINNSFIGPLENFKAIKLTFVEDAFIQNNVIPNRNMLLQADDSIGVKVSD